jgi:hypothetical protein
MSVNQLAQPNPSNFEKMNLAEIANSQEAQFQLKIGQ